MKKDRLRFGDKVLYEGKTCLFIKYGIGGFSACVVDVYGNTLWRKSEDIIPLKPKNRTRKLKAKIAKLKAKVTEAENVETRSYMRDWCWSCKHNGIGYVLQCANRGECISKHIKPSLYEPKPEGEQD